MLPIIIISDCRDDNARMRLTTRVAALIPDARNIAFCGVENDLEAAGHLVDALDALKGEPGLIMLNVAPRNGRAKQWPNGSPFGHFVLRRTHVLTTVGGLELSLLVKLAGEPLMLQIFDVATVSAHLGLCNGDVLRVARTQFRSYEFLPRVAAAVLRGECVTSKSYRYETKAPGAVWYVDAFGNVKLTLEPHEVGFEPHRSVSLRIAGGVDLNIVCFPELAVIPNRTPGLTVGSSGLDEHRFLELQIQGGRAANVFGLAVGSAVVPVSGSSGAARPATVAV